MSCGLRINVPKPEIKGQKDTLQTPYKSDVPNPVHEYYLRAQYEPWYITLGYFQG